MAVDWLAAGLDPEKCAIFIQSEVKEHAELHLIFSMLITVPTLTRLPTYQEKKDTLDSYGFLGYPVLQAADICLYNAHKVPVGKDQEKHIWLANDLAKRFNATYKKVFVEPEALFTEIPLILGADNRKMSKSYGNHIPIDATEEQTEKILEGISPIRTSCARVIREHPEVVPGVLVAPDIHRRIDHEMDIAPPCRTGELGLCRLQNEAGRKSERRAGADSGTTGGTGEEAGFRLGRAEDGRRSGPTTRRRMSWPKCAPP